MNKIRVACAIIENEGKVLCTQRNSYMSLPLKWEFPGGKIEDGESPEDCLKRELIEEIGVEVSVIRPLSQITHQYLTFTVTLYPFICRIIHGEISLREHKALIWLPPERLNELDWAEADFPVIEDYKRSLGLWTTDQ